MQSAKLKIQNFGVASPQFINIRRIGGYLTNFHLSRQSLLFILKLNISF